MGQINTNNYPTVESLADADLLIVENLTNGTGTTTPKQLKENAIGTDPLQTTSQTVTGAINELKSRIDGGGSYSAGAGINIANNVITNIRRGALPGVIDEITSGGYAHTQINNAFDSITAGGLVVLKTEASGTANTVRIQYGEQASQSQAYRLCDTDLEYTTINVSVGDTIILMFDTTGYKLIVLSILNNSGGSGGDSYAGLGIGKMTSFTNDVIDTDIDLHRAPVEGDRLLVYISETVSNPSSIKTYNNGVAVTTDITFSQTYPVGLAIFRYTLLGWDCIQTITYSAGTGISITGTTISNSAPQLGMNIDYGEVTSVTDGNIGVFNGNADYLDIDFKVNASPYNGGYTLQLATSGSVAIMKYATLKDSYGSAYDKDIQQGTILHCLSKVSGTGTAQDPFVVKVIDENVIANPTGTPDYNLKKVKVGSYIYDALSIKPYEAYSISNGGITIHTADPSTYNGQIIAVSTGTHSGTTTNAWHLVLVGNGSSYPIAMTNADGTAFTDDIGANELLFVAIDLTNYEGTILSVVGKSEDEIKTATGNPITLTDAVAGNAIDVSAEIVANQDLHGYDKPWVGSEKNKMPLVLSDIKTANTGGTWTGNSFVKNGLTFEVLTDSADNVLGVKVNGTANAVTEFYVTAKEVVNSFYGMKINGAGTGSSTNLALIFTYLNGQGSYIDQFKVYNNAETTISSQSALCTVSLYVARYQSVTDFIFYPMISANGGAFEQYSNICPISGFSSVVITDVDSESQTATVTVALGQTVYGGTLDLTSGELTVTHANIASYNGETIGEPWISSMDEYTEGGTPTTGAQVVYPLATPTTTTLTAAQLALVKGYNQLSCNSGDMSITYKASGLDALKERVDELEDAVADLETDVASKAEKTTIGTVESGTTASQAYAVGEHFIRNDAFCTAIAAIASGATLTLNTNYVEGTIAEALTRAETYSTTETLTGETWIDGRQIYRKVLHFGALPVANVEKAVSTGISYASIRCLKCDFVAWAGDGSLQITTPVYVSTSGASNVFNGIFTIDPQTYNLQFRLQSTIDLTSYTDSYVIIEYIKL